MTKKDKFHQLIKRLVEAEVAQQQAQAQQNPQDIQRARVQLFFQDLEKRPGLMNKLNFTSPTEQAQAIVKFAQLVGVPTNKIPQIISTLRQTAKIQ